MRGLLVVFFAAGLLLAGCGGPNLSSPPQCTPPRNTQTVLVYPAPNSTAIPDNFGLVVLGSTAALPGGFQAFVINETTQNSVFFNFVGTPPNPLPTPNAVPAFANPVYQASGNPGVTFVAGSSIAIFLNNVNSNCNPTLKLGSFTVQ